MAELKDQIDLAERILARNLAWVAAADSKVQAVFGIDAAMLGILATLTPLPQQWSVACGCTAVVAGLLLLASVACLGLATFPRLEGPNDSIVYFGTASNIGSKNFIERVQTGFTMAFALDVATQAHRNAQIASVKYRFVKGALVLVFCALPPWLLSVWLLYSARS